MKKFLLLVVTVLGTVTTPLFAQLNDFIISAAGTPQTCLGNGSLDFTVSGNNTAADLEFAVYLLPNTTVPFTTVTAMTAQNLIAGDYLIIATQTLNGQSNTATANATVGDNTVPLTYTLLTQTQNCGEGSITVTVTSGNVVQYEIISGPVTVPLQTSNVFNGLPPGQYQVRVHDNCGDAFTTTVQLITGSYDIEIKESNLALEASCNTITVAHYVQSSAPIAWPLQLQYTVYPPAGGAQVIVNNTAEGPGNILTELPLYEGGSYVYYIEVTDACGNVFNDGPYLILAQSDFNFTLGFNVCTPTSLTVAPTGVLTYPLTFEFLEAPAGFNPADYYPSYPVFDIVGGVAVFSGASLSYGVYKLRVTDACGRVIEKQTLVVENIFPPTVEVTSSCQEGSVHITMPGKAMTGLVVTQAPDAYGQELPYDLLGDLGQQYSFSVNGLPAGNYVLHLSDECGYEYDIQFTVMPQPVNVQYQTLPGCEEGYGTVRVIATGESINSFIITQAPEGFAGTLPFDASANVSNGGQFAMAGLPGGTYSYSLTVEGCDEAVTGTLDITGYQEYTNDIEVIPNCGSFDLQMHHVSNSNYESSKYWLQRYDENLGLWVHPGTGASNGDVVNNYTAIALNNNTTNYNLPYTGQFRVVKMFNVFNAGLIYDLCYIVLDEFTFTGVPQIEAAYGFPCDNGLAEVIVVANGVDPLTYQITTKNGEPFLIDNGTSNVFTGLEKAVYNFRVTDACGNLVNVLYDVSVLEFIEIEAGPICSGQPVQLQLPEFTFLLYEWFRADNPANILSTDYFLDIPSFDPETDAGLYVVHVVSVTPGSCIDTLLSYNAVVSPLPKAGNDAAIALCSHGNILDLAGYLSGEYDANGAWQDAAFTGALNGSMLNTASLNPGTYTFYYTVSQCDTTDSAQITLTLLEDNSYQVLLEGKCVGENYIISIVNIEEIGATQQIEWQGPGTFSQTGNETFADVTGLPAGQYSVQVVNADGCIAIGSNWIESTDCSIPKGISPNGDDWNNEFDLSNLKVQHLAIFNRYGLKVYEKDNYINEWHGQSDSGDLPTGTYYYAVTLSDGKQKTGWVYLQREIK